MRKFRRLIALLIMVTMLMSNSVLTLTVFGEEGEGEQQQQERVIDKSVYMDPDQPIEVRVEALLAQMTLEEKVGQTTQLERSNANNYQTMSDYIKNYYLGSILSGGGAVPISNTFEGWIEMIYAYQTAALSTPLGIPILYEIDAVHGDGNVAGVTVFPHNIGLGAANDEALMERIGTATAAEMRAVGHYGNFAPTIPTPQNIRWGRTYEGFGSDYDLNAKLGAAYTIGLQGGVPEDATALNTDAEHPNQFEFLDASNTAAATMKHYFGEGIVFHNGTVNQGNAFVEGLPSNLSGMTPEELLANETIAQLLAPYAEMVEAGARSMMPSFSSINGIKMHQQKELIDLLKLPKEEGGLGFTGFVVADYRAHTQLNGATQKIRNAQMLNAGVDLAMVIQTSELTNQSTGWFPTTIQNVQEGAVSMERLDDAVRRILRVKFEMGLFEDPMPDVTDLRSEIRSEENLDIAREAVRKSLVLLKNDSDIVGSLKDMDNVMVTGRFAHNMGYQCGGWTIAWQGVDGNSSGIAGTTFLEATQKVVDNVGYSVDGTRVEGDTTDYEAVILCIGETPYAEGNGDASANATGSRNTLQLDYADLVALQNVKRDFPDTPIVVMLFSGRPMIINNEIDDMDGLVVAWWPGSEGDGMADVLFGNYDFTGKTPFAWPWYSEWVNDDSKEVMFEVGYGLKKGQTGDQLVAPQRQTNPYRVYTDGTRTNISSGSFSSVTNASSDGVPAVEPSPVKNRYGYLNPVTLQSPTSANFGDANWLEYDIFVEADGSYSLTFDYVATANTTAGFTAYIDGNQVASYDLANTSGNIVKTDASDMELTEGSHTLRVNYGRSSGTITLKKAQIYLTGTEEPDYRLSIFPNTIAEGFAANVSVKADVADNVTASLEYSGNPVAAAAFENGLVKFSFSEEDTAVPGTYTMNIYDEYGTILATDTFEILPYNDSLFDITYSALSNSVYATFGDNIEINSSFAITVNGENASFTVVDGKTILFDLDYDKFDDVNEIVVSGINFTRYFPSYLFTLNTTWDKANDQSTRTGGTVALIDANTEPAGSIADLDKLPGILGTLKGSFTWLVEGYDWGPGVSKLFLKLDEEVNASDIDAETFSVTANDKARKINDAYLSDADGNRVDADSGNYVTIELGFNYSWFEIPGLFGMGTTDGSPFTYSGMNVWTDPYTQVVKLNKPIGSFGSINLEDKGKLTPEADKFDTSGKYYYLDSKHGLINLKYATYSPEEEGTRPLVIWLHGAGEGGTDPTIVLYGNKVVNLASDEIQDIFEGAYVLTPQSPTMWMNDGTGSYTSDGTSMYTKALMALIKEYVDSNPNIDRDRIYIGGCSNGGFMTMNMIINYPDYFTAAYPICEAYNDSWITDAQIKAIKDIPIWFTHSKDDTTVRIDQTTNPTYARLVAAGAENVHKSTYEKVVDLNGNRQMGHWSWIYTLNNQCVCDETDCEYADLTIMEWMSQQTKTETLNGSFTWLVEGFDWGPGVSKLYLELDEAVKASDISADTFSVTANGAARVVKDVYLARADGSRSNALTSKYVTIELDFVYTRTNYVDRYDYSFGSYDGNPFTYAGGRNNWTDPYTQVITLNKPVGGYGYISLTDNGKLTPEIDKFDTTGSFTHGDITMSYASYVPDVYTIPENPGQPLIIWLHGGGEGGTNPEIALYANRAASFASDETQRIFGGGGVYVLVPQCPTRWMDGYNSNAATLEAAGQSIYTDALMALIKDYVAAHPGIDMNRIYIGGCSNGGYMAVNLLLEDPGYFAAAFPTCSPYQSAHITDEMLKTIVDTPIWFTHSKVDGTVAIETTTNPLYDRLVAAGAANVHKYTPDSVVDSMYGNNMNGHWSWIYVYNNDACCDIANCEYEDMDILDWMAKQSKEQEEVYSHTAYINGYKDGTFRADSSITRAEVAQMLYNLGDLDETNANVTFSDVKTGSWYYDPVMALAKAGIINGYKDGTFQPDATITRAEFVTMIVRYTKLSQVSGSTGFSDVPTNHWAAGYIKASADAKYVKGYDDGTFGPDKELTRAETVTVINRVFGRVGSKDNIPESTSIFPDVKRDHYAWADIVEAAVAHQYTIENGNEVWVK